MRLACTQGVLSNSYFVALVTFLMAEWQLRYSSAPDETQPEQANAEISWKKCLWWVVRDFPVTNWWNGWDRKASLKVMLPSAAAQSGPARSGCPGPGSWIYPRRETPPPLHFPGKSLPALSHPHSEKVFLDVWKERPAFHSVLSPLYVLLSSIHVRFFRQRRKDIGYMSYTFERRRTHVSFVYWCKLHFKIAWLLD